jgi:hypothetical protein
LNAVLDGSTPHHYRIEHERIMSILVWWLPGRAPLGSRDLPAAM